MVRTPSSGPTLGENLLGAVRRAIQRTVTATRALPLPGEGNERPFRNWLRSSLLVDALGWPEDRIRVGEVFDILLLDEHNRGVVTIETKAPFKKSSAKERDIFVS